MQKFKKNCEFKTRCASLTEYDSLHRVQTNANEAHTRTLAILMQSKLKLEKRGRKTNSEKGLGENSIVSSALIRITS